MFHVVWIFHVTQKIFHVNIEIFHVTLKNVLRDLEVPRDLKIFYGIPEIFHVT